MGILLNPLYSTVFAVRLVSPVSFYSPPHLHNPDSDRPSYVIHTLNLAGPPMQVGKTFSGEVYRQGHERLREHFSEPPQPVCIKKKNL